MGLWRTGPKPTPFVLLGQRIEVSRRPDRARGHRARSRRPGPRPERMGRQDLQL